jgi:hypothetical protein
MCLNCTQTTIAAAESLGIDPQLTKTIALATSAIMIFSLAAPLVIPTKSVKAGATCVTVNQKIKQSNKILVCKKSGKKLVWKVQSQKPVKPAVTQPIPQPVVPPVVTKPLLPWQQQGKEIYERFDQIKDAPKANFDFILSPTVNRAKAQETIDAYNNAMKFWTPLQEMKKPLHWVLMSENDYDWWRKTVIEIEGAYASTGVWNPINNELGHCRVQASAFCGYGSVYPNGTNFQYNLIGSSFAGKPSPHVVHHEAVHFYQMQIGLSYQKFPWWLIEGQANFYGWNLAERDKVEMHRNREKGRLAAAVPNAAKFTQAEWVKLIRDCTANNTFCFKNGLGYSVGWFAMEHLMSKISIAEMHKLSIEVAGSMTWQTAIPNYIKISADQLDSEIAEYLVSVYKN